MFIYGSNLSTNMCVCVIMCIYCRDYIIYTTILRVCCNVNILKFPNEL